VSEVKPITNISHGKLKIKENATFIQSEKMHFSPIVVQEFIPASREFPIVFIKEQDTGRFNAVVLFGLEPGENLFFDANKWQASYSPLALTLYPFLIHQTENSDNALLCIDENSPLINESVGDALFDENGKEMKWLTQKGEAIVNYIEQTKLTKAFIQLLLENEILSSQTLSIKIKDQKEFALNGLYVVDEKKLSNLSDEDFLKIRKSGALDIIYASINSMQSVNNLVRRKIANS